MHTVNGPGNRAWHPRGATIWLTGLPSAGKTTIARAVAAELHSTGRDVQILDGDELRRELCADLGFSWADRETSMHRAGIVAQLLAAHGVVVLVAVIAPSAAGRDRVRELHSTRHTPYAEVHVATPVEVCRRRDVKGLYERFEKGALRGLTGADDPYEAPESPELVIDTDRRTVGESARQVLALLSSEEWRSRNTV